MTSQTTTQGQYRNNNNGLLNIIRFLVGALFIFSGLIKANDPSGLAFKMEDFFELWGMEGLAGTTMVLSILIITFEIVAGAALILGYKFRSFSFLLLLLMLFFMFLTSYAVIYEANTGTELKCGCFGDCIPLTAWQSFWKDVVLLILVIYLFIRRKQITAMLPGKKGVVAMLIVLASALLIQWVALRYLPYVDCLPFREGENMFHLYKESENLKDSFATSFVYEIDGKRVTKSYDDYMADSTLWELEPVETINEVVRKAPSYAAIMRGFHIVDQNGQEYQEDIFKSEDAYFIFFIRKLEDMNKDHMDQIRKIYDDLNQESKAGMITVTASPIGQVQKTLADLGMPEMQIFTLDEVNIKTAIRSNPGLMLIQSGIIKGKWTPANYPSGFTFEGHELVIQ